MFGIPDPFDDDIEEIEDMFSLDQFTQITEANLDRVKDFVRNDNPFDADEFQPNYGNRNHELTPDICQSSFLTFHTMSSV